MEQILGMILLHQLQQALDADMGRVLLAAHPSGPPEGQPEPGDPAAHLGPGVLEEARVIPHAATQTQNAQAVVHHQMAVDALAALRGRDTVFFVVVAVDIEQRLPPIVTRKVRYSAFRSPQERMRSYSDRRPG